MFSEEQAKQIIRSLVLAVNYLHLKGIVHRSINPSNLVFLKSDSMQVNLVDFGGSADTKREAMPFTAQTDNKVQYNSPEVLGL